MATVQRRGSRVTRQPVSRAVVGGALTETAWLPTSELGFDDWIEHGRRLGVIGRASGWWIGDWLRYGNTEFGERYVRASRITGYDAQTLMNMVYVAAAVPPDERRHALSWSHHAELAALPSEERARWMDTAEVHRLSVRCLRSELRRHKPRARPARSTATAERVATTAEPTKAKCPHCGHALAAPD